MVHQFDGDFVNFAHQPLRSRRSNLTTSAVSQKWLYTTWPTKTWFSLSSRRRPGPMPPIGTGLRGCNPIRLFLHDVSSGDVLNQRMCRLGVFASAIGPGPP